ncbi:MAG: hypothetical protein H7263_12790 [Candidatus Sericytochromatia bacterium]|nr:hypothetical protein [Candidatus Sericytochromatia bacterium]
MTNVNSAGRGQVQLESLDSMRSTNLQQQQNQEPEPTISSGLQSLDSIVSNRHVEANGGVPNTDVLAPIDAINPEIPGQDIQDTKEGSRLGFIGGVFKGFGKAGIDTVKGFATLGVAVGKALLSPGDIVTSVGHGISYAVNHPINTVKTLAIDLPIGIVKGIVTPYAEAIHQGKFGEALGRGIFDGGLVLLTAGLGDKAADGSKAATGAVEAANKGSKAAKVIESASEGTKVVRELGQGTKIVTKGVQGGIKIGSNAIKVGNVTGNVIINIGNTTAEVSSGVSRAAEIASATTETVRGGRGVIAATEAIGGSSGRIAIGLGDLGGTMSRGASRIANLFRPIGARVGDGLSAFVGPQAAATISQGFATVGRGISVGGHYVKQTALFVKAHPIPSALIAGKTVDVLDKGLRATDNYNVGNDNLPYTGR